MNTIQDNKSKATLLQQHLTAAGLHLPRSSALNIIAKLEGYRSHTVAKRGAQHLEVAKKPVLYSGISMQPDVQCSYVASHGKHCPYCGSAKLFDAQDSRADVALWDVKVGCHACDKRWFAVYELVQVCGLGVRDSALQEALDGRCSCAHCGHADVEYQTFVPGADGGRAYQTVRCPKCLQTYADVFKLTGLAELDNLEHDDVSSPTRYLVSDGWGHLFGPGIGEVTVRFVLDRITNQIPHMQILEKGVWVTANEAQKLDVADSVVTANDDALVNPVEWDLLEQNELPHWAFS